MRENVSLLETERETELQSVFVGELFSVTERFRILAESDIDGDRVAVGPESLSEADGEWDSEIELDDVLLRDRLRDSVAEALSERIGEPDPEAEIGAEWDTEREKDGDKLNDKLLDALREAETESNKEPLDELEPLPEADAEADKLLLRLSEKLLEKDAETEKEHEQEVVPVRLGVGGGVIVAVPVRSLKDAVELELFELLPESVKLRDKLKEADVDPEGEPLQLSDRENVPLLDSVAVGEALAV